VAGIEVEEAPAALAGADAALDRLNARYGWGLIPRQRSAGGWPATVLEPTRGGWYGSLGEGEKPAVAAVREWLILCSNLNALERLLAEPGGAGDAVSAEPGESLADPAGFITRAAEAADASVYVAVDPEATGRALRNAAAVYSLAVHRDGDRGELISGMLASEAWLESLRPLGVCYAWLASDGLETHLRLRFGPARGPGTNGTHGLR
jgi:hypothetical protein